PDGRLLAADVDAHGLLLLSREGTRLRVKRRLTISPYPVEIAVARDGRRAFVASLWSRRVSVVDVPADESDAFRVAATLDLPLAPHKLLWLEDRGTLIVGDNFGGRLAVVDAAADPPQLKTVRKFFAENIRGLAVDPKSGLLAVSHTMLNEFAHTIRNDVHWGVLMSNDLRWLQLAHVIDPAADFYTQGHMHPLGEPGMGGSEPAELAFFADGTVVVPLAGVDKVAIGREGDFAMHRLDVGRCPTTAALSDKHRRAFVANLFDDSLSVIDIEEKNVAATIALGPMRPLTDAEQGEKLFRDGRLSHDGWMTCNTCHAQGHTAGGLNDNFSDKSFGAPKRVLSLLGVKDTAPYAWNGSSASLAEQIKRSSAMTMQGRELSEQEIGRMVAYLQTLEPPPSVDALRGGQDQKSVARGKTLFGELRCVKCHAPPLYTSADLYDVGIHDKQGNTHFNPPSLRGVGQRGPYFHDAGAASLDDVFVTHGHQLDGRVLSDDELRDLLNFLRSL
ncbi:MAG: c-type cytochrome, partial [Planctomycetales bacterium]|nr:c-type cytochrome [Planctomycetales bacterium]